MHANQAVVEIHGEKFADLVHTIKKGVFVNAQVLRAEGGIVGMQQKLSQRFQIGCVIITVIFFNQLDDRAAEITNVVRTRQDLGHMKQ